MRAHAEAYGDGGLESFLEKIEEYWEEVCKRIVAAGLYGPKAAFLHIFVDGLPYGDENKVRRIVEDLVAARKIPAYRIIAKLQEYGAKVHGTEDFGLLLEEYKYFKALSEGKNGDPEAAQARLMARDAAIALRIQEILNDGDVGILFIGKMHDVIGKLPDEFIVVNL